MIVKQRQRPAPKVKAGHSSTPTAGKHARGKTKTKGAGKSKESGNVAGAPGSVAQLGALQALLSSSQTSSEALQFYRIPLFLLPIYKAAAVQYGVPWQVLAAVNEIETNYGTDLNVSSAGAVGWMQFMPATWLQYGVDALEAGYADPYNPVDAIFAAARYLRAAGAQTNLPRAILRLQPLAGIRRIGPAAREADRDLSAPGARNADRDGRRCAPGHRAPRHLDRACGQRVGRHRARPEPGGARAAHPRSRARRAAPRTARSSPAAGLRDGEDCPASPRGRRPGRPRREHGPRRRRLLRRAARHLRRPVHLRGARQHRQDVQQRAGHRRAAAIRLSCRPQARKGPAPARAASAGAQQPQTIVPRAPKRAAAAAVQTGGAYVPEASVSVPAGMGRVRLYAHPRNPDARVAAADARARAAATALHSQRLGVGSVLAKGTVIGDVATAAGGQGSIRFAVRPNGDATTIDPTPLLANWAQLQKSLHPAGARASNALLGATSSDVFLYSPAQLRRSVLADPGITIGPCERRAIADGAVDSRLLAVLAYLSRSGLQPTVAADGCKAGEHAVSVDIAAINGIEIAGHQGAGSITDLTIRALLTLPSIYAPQQIISLMHYPGQYRTKADAKFAARIRLAFTAQASAARIVTRPAKTLPTVGITLLTPDRVVVAVHADRVAAGAFGADASDQVRDHRPARLPLAPSGGVDRAAASAAARQQPQVPGTAGGFSPPGWNGGLTFTLSSLVTSGKQIRSASTSFCSSALVSGGRNCAVPFPPAEFGCATHRPVSAHAHGVRVERGTQVGSREAAVEQRHRRGGRHRSSDGRNPAAQQRLVDTSGR